VVGFITMENGVYLFGVAFSVREPWMVQTGVLLDVFAAVFVMGIMIYRIQQEFDHIDTDRLSDLKD
jgi:hydrogenase-4 component E